MSINPYSLCPCGSGKQFKWCCQNYYSQIEKAQDLYISGQKAIAQTTIDKLVEQYPKQPQVWTTRAQIYYGIEKRDEADAFLDEAIKLDPNFAPAYFLKASFRLAEDEEEGALLLLRQCASVVSPKATDWISRVYGQIANMEMELGRPVLARAAADLALRYDPLNQELREGIKKAFEQSNDVASVAGRPFAMRAAPAGSESVYDGAMPDIEHGRFAGAIAAIGKLTTDCPNDSTHWFNLGLIKAWSGDPAGALEALLQSLDLESDDARALETATLIECLRLGDGMEDVSDYFMTQVFLQVNSLDGFSDLVQKWSDAQRMRVVNQGGENEPAMVQLLEQSLVEGAPVRSIGLIALDRQGITVLASHASDSEAIVDEFREAFGPALVQVTSSDRLEMRSPLVRDLPVYVNKVVDEAEAQEQVRNAVRDYWEERWAKQPLKSLGGISPVDAMADPKLRKRLMGVVEFVSKSIEDVWDTENALYDFNRLRARLGLPTIGASSGPANIDLMSAADLQGLALESLSDAQVEEAYRRALKLELPVLVSRFADAARERTTIADRYAYFADAIRRAREAGNTAEELRLIELADAADRATNDGKRAATISLTRGRALVKAKRFDEARAALESAIAASPDDLSLRSNATETMLSAGQGAAALALAEAGLAHSRQLQQRDAEQQFLELKSAAERLR